MRRRDGERHLADRVSRSAGSWVQLCQRHVPPTTTSAAGWRRDPRPMRQRRRQPDVVAVEELDVRARGRLRARRCARRSCRGSRARVVDVADPRIGLRPALGDAVLSSVDAVVDQDQLPVVEPALPDDAADRLVDVAGRRRGRSARTRPAGDAGRRPVRDVLSVRPDRHRTPPRHEVVVEPVRRPLRGDLDQSSQPAEIVAVDAETRRCSRAAPCSRRRFRARC